MASYDPKMAARVWQRVQSSEGSVQEGPDLSEMISQELAAAATYLHLSRRLSGSDSTILRRIQAEELSHADCLKGICDLTNGACPAVRKPTVSQEPALTILRRCYHHELQSAEQYERLAADPQYGRVYASLAVQERAHSRLVLEILGRFNKL